MTPISNVAFELGRLASIHVHTCINISFMMDLALSQSLIHSVIHSYIHMFIH